MKLVVPNLPDLTGKDVQLGEALKATQSFINLNVDPIKGNKVSAPPKTLVNPITRPG